MIVSFFIWNPFFNYFFAQKIAVFFIHTNVANPFFTLTKNALSNIIVMYNMKSTGELNKMKNKIISIAICAALLLSCFAMCISADDKTSYGSGIFTLSATSENMTFTMTDAGLSQITVDYFNTAFDNGDYDATFYGAFKASLSVDGADTTFTSDMSVTAKLGDAYANNEIFIFYITDSSTASDCVTLARNAGNATINGSDFETMSNNIIVIMTSNQPLAANTASPVIPACICAGIALVAIAVTIIFVKRKNGTDSIIG